MTPEADSIKGLIALRPEVRRRLRPLAIRARVHYTSPQEDTSHEPRPGKAHAQLVSASEPR